MHTTKQQLQQGSHHVVLVIAAVALLVGVLGFLGFNAYQKNEANAATTSCKGVYYLNTSIKGHSACWSTPGAYLVNIGKGGNKIDHVAKKQSVRMQYPNYVIVVSGYWKVCDDKKFAGDICSTTKMKKGVHKLCTPRKAKRQAAVSESWPNYNFCTKKDIYIEKL